MKKLALLTAVGLGLAACAPAATHTQPATHEPLSAGALQTQAAYDQRSRPNKGIDGSRRNLLAMVRPSVGRGGTYPNAADIRLELTVRSDGYLNIQRLDESGAAHTLLSDYAVKAGHHMARLPRAAFARTGLQRLRVSFSQPRTATDIVLGGAEVNGKLRPTTIGKRLTPQRAGVVRDVQETFFYIQE